MLVFWLGITIDIVSKMHFLEDHVREKTINDLINMDGIENLTIVLCYMILYLFTNKRSTSFSGTHTYQ